MVTAPTLTPVICGCTAGCVWPPAILTVVGDMVSLFVLLFARVTVRPEGGAGVDKVIGKATDLPNSTEGLAGSMIVPGFTTITSAVASGKFAAVARITA